MKYGELFKDSEGWWFTCPEYETYGCVFDAMGPYPTKADAKAAWVSLTRSYRKHDKTYGRDQHECTGSSRPVRGEWSETGESEGLRPDPPSEPRRTGKRRKRGKPTAQRSGGVGSSRTKDKPDNTRVIGGGNRVEAHAECCVGAGGGPDGDGGNVLPRSDLARTTDLSSMIGEAFSFL